MANSRSTFFAVIVAKDEEGKVIKVKDVEVLYFGKAAIEAIVVNKKNENSNLITAELASTPRETPDKE